MGKFQVGDAVHIINEGSVGVIDSVSNGKYAIKWEHGSVGDPIWDDHELALNAPVNNSISPSHYSQGMPEGVDVIDVIRAQEADFLHGNVIKYILRWKFKNGVEDLKKAQRCLTWLIEQEEAKASDVHIPYLDN